MTSMMHRSPCVPTCSYPAAAPLPRRNVSIRHGRSRTALRVQAVDYDPENLLGPPMTGHIQRRMVQKQMQTNQEFAVSMRNAKDDVRKEVLIRREMRAAPQLGDHTRLIEFFLNTTTEDMDYEVARCRPLITADFFKELDSITGQERFAAKPDEEKLAELDALRQYLSQAIQVIDTTVQKTSSAKDRLKKLLTAKDKKATILEMAEANEIDQPLIELLQQNIVAARDAEQEDAAKFMEKVLVATSRHFIAVAQAAMPAPPPGLGAAPASSATIDVESENVKPGVKLMQDAQPVGAGGNGNGAGTAAATSKPPSQLIVPGASQRAAKAAGGGDKRSAGGLILP